MSVEIIPKDQPTAQALLEAAEVAGLPADVVRTTDNGFSVPDEVADIFHHGGQKPKTSTKKAAAPRRSRKSAEKE